MAALFAVGACSVFDESMRRHDGGTNGANPSSSGSSGNASSGGGGSSGAGGSSSGASGGIGTSGGGESCSLSLGGAGGAGGTGGPGCPATAGGTFAGASEVEPNDGTPEILSPDTTVCGSVAASDVDAFVFPITAQGCANVHVDLDGSGATATLTAPGFGVETLSVTSDIPLQATSDGKIAITISTSTAASSAYKLVVR